MLITNEQLAEALHNIADTLEEQEENPYRIRAYRRAANSLKHYKKNIADLIKQDFDLQNIPNIGEKLSKIIKEMVLTNNLNWLPKSQPALLYPQELLKKNHKPRIYRIYSATTFIERIILRLKKISDIKKLMYAGDYRRKKEVIHSVSILIVTNNAKKVFNEFHSFPSIKFILANEQNSTAVQLKNGMQVSLHAVSEQFFYVTLLQETGSAEHYHLLQQKAHENQLELNEKGLFKNNKLLTIESEEAIYDALHMDFIAPELRENRGEIEAASNHRLPDLIQLRDIKGDLHCHTNETDGSFTLEEMVQAAIDQGYQYVAITDHSQSLKITNGMDEKRLLKQIEQIEKLNATLSDFVILKAMEVDILEDGSLDLSNDVLKELDLTVCSIHSKFHIGLEKQTERILRAMDNPYFNILGHATGRLINHRPPYAVDITRVLHAAKERNCFIEVNAQPARLDINDIYCKQAKEIGVKVAISSDAHTMKGFSFMILGVNQARRGWLEANDVINTYDLPNLRILLKRY